MCMCIADFDECRFGATDCDENATCINLDGSFDCTCFDGFIGDGRNCYSNGMSTGVHLTLDFSAYSRAGFISDCMGGKRGFCPP